MLESIPTAIRCQRGREVRHQCTLVRRVLANQIQKAFRRISLDVELRRHHIPEDRNIIHSDMSLIRSGMYSNPFGTKCLAITGHLGQVRQISSTGIADQGYFVQVDTQACLNPFDLHAAKIHAHPDAHRHRTER